MENIRPNPLARKFGFQPDPRLSDETLGPDTEVGTMIAAKLLGVSQRTMRSYCDEGVLEEGKHWRRNTPTAPYFIRRRALIAKKSGHF